MGLTHFPARRAGVAASREKESKRGIIDVFIRLSFVGPNVVTRTRIAKAEQVIVKVEQVIVKVEQVNG